MPAIQGGSIQNLSQSHSSASHAVRFPSASGQSRRQQACRHAYRRPLWQLQAKKGNPDPPDIPKEERRGNAEWLQTLLSRFGPMTERPQNTFVLDFEKPLVELDNRIREVRSQCALCYHQVLMSSDQFLETKHMCPGRDTSKRC